MAPNPAWLMAEPWLVYFRNEAPVYCTCERLYIGEVGRYSLTMIVIPAQAGIQSGAGWIPAPDPVWGRLFAGMTDRVSRQLRDIRLGCKAMYETAR